MPLDMRGRRLLCSTMTMTTVHCLATMSHGNAATSPSALTAAATSASASASAKSVSSLPSLQTYHEETSPAQTLRDLATACEDLNVTEWDVYGDYHVAAAPAVPPNGNSTNHPSFLRNFESELARELGMEDVVIMPSGVMAQSIALLIHDEQTRHPKQSSRLQRSSFLCHPTSHLLLHEHDAHSQLLGMEALVVTSDPQHPVSTTNDTKSPCAIPPLLFDDVVRTLHKDDATKRSTTAVTTTTHHERGPSTLLLELPHRELGGALTPWTDVERMRDYCRHHGLRFHCDGARLFEATSGYDKKVAELAEPFDSVYLSFYKGLGGLAGAALCGSKEFCAEARVWLRRMGGNVYTLLPYVISGMVGYRKYFLMKMDGDDGSNNNNMTTVFSFADKKLKLVRVLGLLQQDETVKQIVRFHPSIPDINMVHGYLRASVDDCQAALDDAFVVCGIRALHRIRALPEDDIAFNMGFRSKFEWTMGDANVRVPDEVFLRAWQAFSTSLRKFSQR